ncbi:patatin-like phospholipase domain-containing protein 2 [Argiope bruennichi]|uniref:triacylglycerol lipase n=1 Tax=Argiope bruennichi TaxID=94029 RepID=A0A8T0E408_ARGBR|nr:patatin-like phospholipase domain-containing protein 2 [Argiope bruennichi]XP_055937842.1 patatin-like phospholipase domain-containing protein 2 [Argiope bruennichi]KAF8764621.1 Patatin-like phospholipase domain-containing [Argiope bruennichi]
MINLSFAGCGFLGIYHVGVASCFREYAPHVLVSKIAGASVGSVAAAALICDVSLGQTTTDILSVAVKARSQTLGPLSPRFDLNSILKERLENALPENAHILCSGRLFISVTRWSDNQNVILSQFNSRQELIQALLCSCFIPYYSGLNKPKFQGEVYVDGGMSDNLPVLDDNTVTVSPFAGEHDICPQDESCNILQVNLVNTSIAVSPGNIYRMFRILFPPKPEVLSKMCQQGFDDALKFLQRKNIITCTRCLGIQSVVKISEPHFDGMSRKSVNDIEMQHPYDDCIDCRYKRQMASLGNLPEAVVDAIQDACDQVNKGLVNWLYRRRPVKLLSILSLPYTIPLDISIVIFAKIWNQLPSLRKEMLSKFQGIVDLIKLLLKKLDPDRKIYSAMFSCELAITEYDYTPEEKATSTYTLSNGNAPQYETFKAEDIQAPKRKISIRSDPPIARMQRKSYAGFPPVQVPQAEPVRRKSFSEISQPERVIRNMKFGFAVGLTSEISKNDKNKDFFQSLKSLGEEDNDYNIMHLANKALKMERQYISQYMNSTKDDSVGKVLDGPNAEAVMSYCYVDEDKTVKITEIYNVTDADTSMVLSDEERSVNSQLQWENDWIESPGLQPVPPVSITDTLDDNEFDTSDVECDLTENIDSYDKSKNTLESIKVEKDFTPAKPYRKMSLAPNMEVFGTKDSLDLENVKIEKPFRKTSFVIVN